MLLNFENWCQHSSLKTQRTLIVYFYLKCMNQSVLSEHWYLFFFYNSNCTSDILSTNVNLIHVSVSNVWWCVLTSNWTGLSMRWPISVHVINNASSMDFVFYVYSLNPFINYCFFLSICWCVKIMIFIFKLHSRNLVCLLNIIFKGE